MPSLCDTEKAFILHGVEADFRNDGRDRWEYRPMDLDVEVVSHALGSARIKLAQTDVIAAVKAEIDVPLPDWPNEGKLEFFVDISANASPEFEGRGGEDLATEIATALSTAYRSAKAFNMTKLCILKGKKCWKLYVDILVLECSGNLYDTISMAVKAALWTTKIPKITSVHSDGDKIELEASEYPHEGEPLDTGGAPIMVTLCKIGDYFIIDPTLAEEECSSSTLVIAVSNGCFTSIIPTHHGSLHPTTLRNTLDLGCYVAEQIDNLLLYMLELHHEETREIKNPVPSQFLDYYIN